MLAEETPAHFVAFDLLALDDDELIGLPFGERRAELEELTRAGIDLTPLTRDPPTPSRGSPTARAWSPRT